MAESEEVDVVEEGGATTSKHEDEKAAEEARQQDLLRKREERHRKMEEDEKRDEEERKKREEERQKRKSERDKRLKEKEASMKKEIEEMEKKAKKEEERRKKREEREARWLAEEAATKEAEERRRKEREERKLQELELEEEERRRKRMEEEAKNQRDEEPVTWVTEEDEEDKALREERKKRRLVVDTIIRYVHSQNAIAVDNNQRQNQEEVEAAWVIERIVMDEAIREEVNSLISEDYKPITDLLVRPPSLFTLIKAVTCAKDGSRLHLHRSELMYSRSPFNPKTQNETASQKNSMLSNSDTIFPPTIPPPIQPVLDPLARSVARVEFALNILTEGVLPVARIVSSSDNHYLLDTLFQMLKDNPPPTPSPNLHLFSKVLSSFMNRRPSEMSDYLTTKANYLIELLVSHFGCPEISELIWKMLESEIMLKSDGLNVPDDELEPSQTGSQPTLSRRNSVTILSKITEPTPLNNSCPSWSDALLPFLATRLQKHERTWKELEDHGGDPVKLEKFESWLKLCGEEIENMGQLCTDILSKYPKSRLARSVLGHTFSSALIHLTFTINPPLPPISSPLLSLIDLLLTQIHKKQHIQIVAQAQDSTSSTPSSPSSRPPPSKAPSLVLSLITPMGERSMNYTPLHILARWMDSTPTAPSAFVESQILLQPRPSTPAQSRISSNDIKKSPLSSASPNDIKLASSKSASSSPSKSRPVVVVSSSSPNGKINHTTSQQSQSHSQQQQQQQSTQTPNSTSPHPIVGMGILRLRALQCVRSLTRLEWEGVNIEGRLVNSGALKSTIKMFFNYPNNNMMHSIISSMIKDLIIRCGEKYDHSPSNSAHNGNSNHNEKVNLTGRNSGAVAKINTGNPSPAVSRLLEHILKECGLISGILKVLKGSPGSGTPSIFPSLDIDDEKSSLAPIPKPIPVPPAENMPYVTSICRDLTHMAVKKKWLQMIIQDCSGEDQWLDLIVVRLGLGTSQEELRWKSSPKPTLNRAPSRYKFVVPTPKVDV